VTLAGWIFLGLAWGLVLGLVGYCVGRILLDGADPSDPPR
jgi:hypothetical protein